MKYMYFIYIHESKRTDNDLEKFCAPKWLLHLLTHYQKFHHVMDFLGLSTVLTVGFFSFLTLYLEIFKHIQKQRKWYKESPYPHHQASSSINLGPTFFISSPTHFISFPQ